MTDNSTPAVDVIHVSDAPDIPGLTFRRFRGESDFGAIAAVIEGCKDADGLVRTTSVNDVAFNYTHLVRSDPLLDMVFAEVDGCVVGYSRVEWHQQAGGRRSYTLLGYLLPEWRRKGIGRAVLRHSERRLREIAATHPQDGARVFSAFAEDTAIGAGALLRSEGYTQVRRFYQMLRPTLDHLPAAPLPPGTEVRPARPEHYRAIWDAEQEAFRSHWGYVPGTEADYRRWLDEPMFQPDLWRIAWDGDQVVGQVRSFINARENTEYDRLRGYTEDISVRPQWRRRGLARALIVMSLAALRERGMSEAALGVDTENTTGALRVYESCGFRAVKGSSAYEKPMT